MATYRNALPQLSGDLFLTDGGIETTLIFHDGLDLPYFAAFDLLKDDEGREALLRYFRTHASIATASDVGFIFESATWRASQDWGDKLGYSNSTLAEANRKAIELLTELRRELESERTPMVISGCVGPRGDGYNPALMMSADEAEHYHAAQVETFAETNADMVTAITMTYADEAIGITRAARTAGMPVVISFTVETDGRLPSGQDLGDAIASVDTATDQTPEYYMINCAHPTHFQHVLDGSKPWTRRIRGIRANASTMSHAELDEAEELDAGNPAELGAQYARLRDDFDHINVLGGCCGTDHRHIQEIAAACLSVSG